MVSAQGTALCPAAVFKGDIAHGDFPFAMFLKRGSLLRPRFQPNPDVVPVECVALGTIESWPKSKKIKQKQVIARGLACAVQARLKSDAIQSAFRGWQHAWRALRALARDIDVDLSSQFPSNARGQRAQTKTRRKCDHNKLRVHKRTSGYGEIAFYSPQPYWD
jgi:hypothetical protein